MPREDRATWKSNYFMKIIVSLAAARPGRREAPPGVGERGRAGLGGFWGAAGPPGRSALRRLCLHGAVLAAATAG